MDMERTTQLILDMQAKHEAWLHDHDAAVKGADERFMRLREQTEERFGNLVDVSLSLANAVEETRQSMEAGFREMREAQVDTNYKLNALIDTVDKIVRNGHKHES